MPLYSRNYIEKPGYSNSQSEKLSELKSIIYLFFVFACKKFVVLVDIDSKVAISDT